MENKTDINILIIRLLSGEANKDEKGIIAEWLTLSNENVSLYNDLKEIWLSSGIPNNADNYQLEEAIHKFREQISAARKPQTKQIDFNQILKYVAIVLLLLALPFSYYFGARSTSADCSMTTISCAYGDKSSIILPDSSRVWLNSGSKLTFSSNFKNGRKVSLEGEAFFSVSKDKNNPFRVNTADIVINVLGTKFNVKAYPDENLVSTTLVEGSVEIESKYEETQMKPDQRLMFDKGTKKMIVQELTNTLSDTEWKNGRFFFKK
jgi:transmembrane sensor